MAYQRTQYVESKRAQARTRVLQAALDLVSAGGWREVQISSVAEAAGVSTGAVYLHFASKTELLCEVYRTQAAAEVQLIDDIATQDGPPPERLAAAIRAFAQRTLANRRLGYAMVLEPTEIAVEEQRIRFHAQFTDTFRALLDAGQASGDFDVDDTQVAAACIFGSLLESLMGTLGRSLGQPRSPRARDEAKRLVDSVLAFCLHGLGRPRALPAAARRSPRRPR